MARLGMRSWKVLNGPARTPRTGLVLALMCAARARLTVVVEHRLLARAALDACGRHGRPSVAILCESQLEGQKGALRRWKRTRRASFCQVHGVTRCSFVTKKEVAVHLV